MTEAWKVYIKGVPGRGAEIVKVLEDIGGRDSGIYLGKNDKKLYYIDHEGKIDYEFLEDEIAKIIMDNYREIKLPEKWKDGDILFNETNNEFAVVKYKCKFDSDVVVTYFVTCYGVYLTDKSIYTGNFRLATKSEITQLYERLHSIGKDWDAEKKQLVGWKWKPKMRNLYWIINTDGHVEECVWYDDPLDNRYFSFGNCFKTKEEAEAMANKVKELLKNKL